LHRHAACQATPRSSRLRHEAGNPNRDGEKAAQRVTVPCRIGIITTAQAV
jgi:hypothetical protein